MRVFINVTYDLKKLVLFQKTLPFLLGKLHILKLLPERMVFAFGDVEEKAVRPQNTVFDMMVKSFPELSGYIRECYSEDPSHPAMSNLPEIRGTEFCKLIKDDLLTAELFCRLAEKIPQPYSLYSAAIILDHIPWFGESNSLPALNADLSDRICAIDAVSNHYDASCGFYQSDCIVLDKRFDWGNSYNPVHFRFEVTRMIESGDFSAADHLILQLNEILGTGFKQKQMTCCFSGEQIRSITNNAKSFSDYLTKKSSAWKLLTMPGGHPFGTKVISNGESGKFKCPSRIPFFKKRLKDSGFIWHNPRVDGDVDFAKIVPAGNFTLHISPWFNGTRFYARIDCAGYNFKISHMAANGRWCSSLEDAELCSEDLKKILYLWETEIIPELLILFGVTPDWYRHSISYGNTIGVVIRDEP